MKYLKLKDHQNICWMCEENISSTKEHKYKSSDLKHFLSEIDDSAIFKIGRKRAINGPKSSIVKYNDVLCPKCNNQNSKHIDNCYDEFSKAFIKSYNPTLKSINFKSIDFKMNVIRFLAKNICCRFYENNLEISKEIKCFVNGELRYPVDLFVSFYRNKDFKKELSEFGYEGESAHFGRSSLSFQYDEGRENIQFAYNYVHFNNLIVEFYYTGEQFDLEHFYSSERIDLKEFAKQKNLALRINEIVKNYT